MLDLRFEIFVRKSGKSESPEVCLAQISLNSIIITNVFNADWHNSKIVISFGFGGDSSLSVVFFLNWDFSDLPDFLDLIRWD
jgi:hypothetical protein